MIKSTLALLFTVLMPASGFVISQQSAPRSKTSLQSSVTAEVSWQIRTATDNDMPEVMDWLDRKAAFVRSLNGKEPSKLNAKPGATLATLFPELPNGKVLFVGDDDVDTDAVTGFCTYNLSYTGFGPPMMWLDRIYVDQTQRSRGAGKALMDELVSIGKEHSCTHMAWIVDERNERGIQFYDRIGAEVTHKDDTLYGMKWVPDGWSE